jgi:hypothetical protein
MALVWNLQEPVVIRETWRFVDSWWSGIRIEIAFSPIATSYPSVKFSHSDDIAKFWHEKTVPRRTGVAQPIGGSLSSIVISSDTILRTLKSEITQTCQGI